MRQTSQQKGHRCFTGSFIDPLLTAERQTNTQKRRTSSRNDEESGGSHLIKRLSLPSLSSLAFFAAVASSRVIISNITVTEKEQESPEETMLRDSNDKLKETSPLMTDPNELVFFLSCNTQ